MRIVRREDVGIEPGVLHFPFPLVAPDIIARLERERDDPQEDRHGPENHRSPVRPDGSLREKSRSREEGDPAEHGGLDKFDRHRGVMPVVETVERGEEKDLGEEREPKTRWNLATAYDRRARQPGRCLAFGCGIGGHNPPLRCLLFCDPLQAEPEGRDVYDLRHPTLQAPGPRPEEKQEERIGNQNPQIHSAAVQVPVEDHREDEQIDDDRRGNEAVAEPHPRQAFRSAVILGHGLEDDAPEEIPVDLDVPFLPAGVGGVAPAFFFEQVKDRFKERVPLDAILAPIVAPPQVAPPSPFRRASSRASR